MQLAANYLMADSKKTHKKSRPDFVPARRPKQQDDRATISSYVLPEELDLIDAARRITRQSRSAFIADAVIDTANSILRMRNRTLAAQEQEPAVPPNKRR